MWAIDEDHAPLYWFPRACPRVTAWPRNDTERPQFETAFCTTAWRVHAVEAVRLDSLRSTKIYRYSLPSESFVAWEASGQWVSDTAVEPLVVLAIGDLLSIHAAARVELRIVADLWPLHDLAVSGGWDFSVVRMTNAVPR